MADVLTGITEVTNASIATISSVAQMYLQQKSILLPTVVDYSYLAVKGTKSIGVPRAAGFTVNDKSENTAVESQAITFAADTINLNKHKVVQWLIEKYADRAASVQVANEAIIRASKDIAYQIDLDIVTELKAASTSAPDHTLVFADTSGDVIAKADILNALKLLGEQNIDARECFIGIGPEKNAEMLALADFIQAERYGSAMPVQNGEFGKIFGAKVLVSNAFADFMCVWHPTAVGFAYAQGMEMGMESSLAHLGTRYSLDVIYGVETLDSGKRNVFVDSTN